MTLYELFNVINLLRIERGLYWMDIAVKAELERPKAFIQSAHVGSYAGMTVDDIIKLRDYLNQEGGSQ